MRGISWFRLLYRAVGNSQFRLTNAEWIVGIEKRLTELPASEFGKVVLLRGIFVSGRLWYRGISLTFRRVVIKVNRRPLCLIFIACGFSDQVLQRMMNFAFKPKAVFPDLALLASKTLLWLAKRLSSPWFFPTKNWSSSSYSVGLMRQSSSASSRLQLKNICVLSILRIPR